MSPGWSSSARRLVRVLKPSGTFVMDLGGGLSARPGRSARSTTSGPPGICGPKARSAIGLDAQGATLGLPRLLKTPVFRVYSKDTGHGDFAPKGPNKSAQGNALGPGCQTER